jgi:hypothetical protein
MSGSPGLHVVIADVKPIKDVSRLASRKCRQRGFWRATAVALGHLLVAVAVLSGVGHSGARYFYCEALGLRTTDPCASASHRDCGRLDTLDETLADCCKVVTLPAVPEGVRAASLGVPPAARVAVTAVSWLADVRTDRWLRFHDPLHLRWRPPPRGPSEARAQLMVFLT